MKRIYQILLTSLTLIILLVGLIFYEIKTDIPENLGCATQIPNEFCGTPDITESQKKGQEIFNTNCAACHKLNSKSTGPALRETDSLVFVKWLTVNKSKIDSTKIQDFGITYHQINFPKSLNKEQLANLIDYCKN